MRALWLNPNRYDIKSRARLPFFYDFYRQVPFVRNEKYQMKSISIRAAIAAIVFGVLDSIWFAIFMKDFAEEKLGHLLRISQSGSLAAHMPSALVAYALMIITAVAFLSPRVKASSSMASSFLIGALLGVCVFGIFDFTNGALLKEYPISFMLIDTLWGGVMYGCVGLIYSKLKT